MIINKAHRGFWEFLGFGRALFEFGISVGLYLGRALGHFYIFPYWA